MHAELGEGRVQVHRQHRSTVRPGQDQLPRTAADSGGGRREKAWIGVASVDPDGGGHPAQLFQATAVRGVDGDDQMLRVLQVVLDEGGQLADADLQEGAYTGLVHGLDHGPEPDRFQHVPNEQRVDLVGVGRERRGEGRRPDGDRGRPDVQVL